MTCSRLLIGVGQGIFAATVCLVLLLLTLFGRGLLHFTRILHRNLAAHEGGNGDGTQQAFLLMDFSLGNFHLAACFYLLLFPVGLILYRYFKSKVGTGWFFGWLLTSIFGFRFLVEFLKDVQEPWELDMVSFIGLNQGQMLSIPFIVVGLYCWLGGKWSRKLGE